MGRLQGRAAFVTGAAGGIGLAIALAMAREGARVGVADINADLLGRAIDDAKGLDIHAYECNVADRMAVRHAVDAHAEASGGLDILVNNAVRFHYAPLAEFPEDIASQMLDVGIKGVYWCFQAATPHLIRRGGGCIINLSSIAVSMAIPNAAVYTSIKGAIDALTRQQAAELGPHGIRVNALAPGSVPTPGANSVIDASGWKSRAGKSVLKRLPTAEEIADAAVFLASDEAKSITGVTLKIDSGMTITGP
ncbi:SDR family oxidoreductase [Chelativorans sp. AA-79]|uniref:SDR family NAD(P)-dependent oxidoreductase n=1 Tax=Chelativorans sp. AA-79 TaxID=3028735 RepID=UPI0023F6AB61|nr:SDR family oxidoreductase [Chelativorans sp. AA-79]WEX08068.1 SDR family NAD(P)-dependent oxidoreductase [Chelativorans sp. AA-79]